MPTRVFRGDSKIPPAGTHWRFGQEQIDRMDREGRRRILFLTRTFQEKDHAEAFLRGQIRAETLAYYRGTEDQTRSDPQEGIFSSGKDWKVTLKVTRKTPNGYAHSSGKDWKVTRKTPNGYTHSSGKDWKVTRKTPNSYAHSSGKDWKVTRKTPNGYTHSSGKDWKVTRKTPNGYTHSSGKDWKVTRKTPNSYAHTLSHEAGERIRIRFNWTDRVNILCTTASYIDTEWSVPDDRYEEVLDRYIRIPEAVKKFGDFAVFVHNTPSFMDLADAAAEKAGFELADGFVDYSGRMPNPKTEELVFCKDSNYKHEREFRLAFLSPQKVEGPITLEVGDLSGVASLVRTQDINGMLTITTGRGPDKDTPEALSWKDDL